MKKKKSPVIKTIQKEKPYNWKRQMSGTDIVKELQKNDWIFVAQKGSHSHYEKNKVKVTAPMHAKKSIPIGTLQSIKRMVNFAENRTSKKEK